MRSRRSLLRVPLVALLALLALSAFPAGRPQSEAEPKAGVFVLRIMDAEVGREAFELLPDGWRTKGSLDLFGKLKSDYEITEQRAEGVTSITFRSKQDGKDVSIDATLTAERFETSVMETAPTTLDLAGKPTPILFQNLVWAYFIDIGQELARRARDGSLKAGDSLDLVELASAQVLTLEVRGFSSVQRVHGGEPLELLSYDLTLAGNVEVTLVTSTTGIPLSFRVLAQKLEAVVLGYEDVQPPAEPRTLVDSGAWRKLLSPPEHAIVVEKKVLAPMRDGVELAADLYRPEQEGKFPTILVRTPYGRDAMGLVYGNYFGRRGYAVVSQDVRGRFDSGGAFEPMRHETEDGSDTLDWIAAQPWSDGSVGMIGGSYLGFVQWAAAKSGNPHLKAIVPQVAPPDPQYNIPYLGGAFFLSSVWWARVVQDMSVLGRDDGLDWMGKLATLPLSDLDKAFGLSSTFLDEWVAHPPHDPWWEPQSYQHDFADMDVPALNISCWYDGDQPGAPMNYMGMRASAKSPRARQGQQLLMGPWTHLFNTSTHIGDLDFGPDAIIDLDAVTLRWFDHYLKGVDNGVEREDPVVVFTMVENAWRREKDWPLPQTRWTKLYLGGSGDANLRDGGGTLALAPEASSPPDHYDYDPARMPDIEIDFDDLSGAQATRDSSQDPDREDVLEFTSPPLKGPVELTGPFSAVLSVTTDAKDTDFVVSLLRIDPSGRTLDLRGGIRRLRYRSGYEREDFAPPGEVTLLEIDMWATGIRLAAGDRLRVEVSSNGFPGVARNLNTGEPDASATKMVIAHQTVFHDQARPSYVLLPVIPRDGLGELEFAAEGDKR